MPIDLKKPLSWRNAKHEEQQMLQALQGNILKGHGRPETTNIFFAFKDGKPHAWRRALREVAVFHVTSAHQQLLETAAFQECGKSGATFVASFLSHKGYEAIERSAAAPKGEPLFEKGMHHSDSVHAVGDAPTDTWEPKLKDGIDGMILVGDMVRNRVRLKRDEIVKILVDSGAEIVYEQVGSALKDKSDNGIEHFGYVDGRSQPLLLVEDIEKESRDAGISKWDPKFPLSAALVAETVAAKGDIVSYGSYFVFRKLEQNVREFKRTEQILADKLGLKDSEKRERAGAQVVGRFEDGTPVTLSDEAQGENPRNDFNYQEDSGTRCPFQAHIRKVNPRSKPADAGDERNHIMPRRGIPYEDQMREMHPSDLPPCNNLADFKAFEKRLPVDKVGLLFMAYNSSLKDQFQFTQKKWANNAGFPKTGVGIDPVIGVGKANSPGPDWYRDWDDPASLTEPFDFQGFVTMRGGEYFFAPSLNFFKGL